MSRCAMWWFAQELGLRFCTVERRFYLVHLSEDCQYADDDEASFGWPLSASPPSTFKSGNNVDGGLSRCKKLQRRLVVLDHVVANAL